MRTNRDEIVNWNNILRVAGRSNVSLPRSNIVLAWSSAYAQKAASVPGRITEGLT